MPRSSLFGRSTDTILSRSLEDSALLAARFSLPAGIDFSQRFQRRAAGFVARPAVVSLEGGLGVRAAIDPDALDAVFACDGSRTLSAIVDGLAARRGLQLDALADVTVRAARELLAYGLLEGCPPRSTSGQPSPG